MSKYKALWEKEGKSRIDILNNEILYYFLSLNKLLDNEDAIIFGSESEYYTVPQLVEKSLSLL